MKTEPKTASHTPGPLSTEKYQFTDEAGNTLIRIWTESDRLIAVIQHPVCEIAEANARLIAAAPELLSALEQTLSAYLDARLVAHGKDWSESNPVIAAARAAIAKATGK